MEPRTWDVVVVGGGQAGMAIAHELAPAGLRLVVLDEGPEAGHSWRSRWDSLRLFTTAGHDALPGLPFPGDPGALPGKDSVADYLGGYCRHFGLPVRWNTRVTDLTVAPDADPPAFLLRTGGGAISAAQVVLATGPFQRPRRPAFAAQVSHRVVQVHSSEYRNADQLPDGPVLVVGAGNSGRQIAVELAATHPVTLARGSARRWLPQSVAGRNVFSLIDRAGLMRVSTSGVLGRVAEPFSEPVVGSLLATLRRRGIRITRRITAADGDRVHDAAGSTLIPRAIVWATGYRPDFSWVRVPVLDGSGRVRQRAGRAAAPGLYTIGLPCQATPGSALLGWVGRDAPRIAAAVLACSRTTRRTPA